ncbi:hypothetical protein AYI70_g2863 [Smittium culicis]|uniref:Uncharacterized protein n=1 Tax=Smittium culicis TaxID=133412 RepID=A0A1R1Y6H2_9FUNG|nr:hypothetical protein AYI70_g2863 [Smittium culicis]
MGFNVHSLFGGSSTVNLPESYERENYLEIESYIERFYSDFDNTMVEFSQMNSEIDLVQEEIPRHYFNEIVSEKGVDNCCILEAGALTDDQFPNFP